MIFSIVADLMDTYWVFLSVALLIGIITGWYAASSDNEVSRE